MTDILRIVIAADPVPSQMGATSLDGKTARKKPKRVTAYQQHVALLAMLAVNRARWTATRSDSFKVTARFFLGDARVVDGDNLFKCLGDGLKAVVFPDDRQITEGHWYKQLDRHRPRTEVEIERLAKEPTDG